MDQRLTDLLSRLSALRESSSAPQVSVAASDLELLGDALLPSALARTRSLAYLCLSKHAEVARAGSSAADSGNDPLLVSSLSRYLLDSLSDAQALPVRRSLALLTALFQVEAKLAAELFQAEGLLDGLMDLVDLPFFADSTEALDVRIAVAELLSEACGVASLRGLVHARASDWLSSNVSPASGQAVDAGRSSRLRMACAVTLTKLAKAIEADPKVAGAGEAGDVPKKPPNVEDLTGMLQSMVISTGKASGAAGEADVVQAIEGLAYASLEPKIKQSLCADPAFLKAIIALAASSPSRSPSSGLQSSIAPSYNLKLDGSPEQRASAALQYGIATILVNCLSKRPTLSEEQAQMEKLRGMASAGVRSGGKKLGEAEMAARDPLDDDDAVEERVAQALEAGVVSAACSLAHSTSSKVKELDGRILLALVDQQRHRRAVLAQGGARALLDIVRSLLAESSQADKSQPTQVSADGLISMQALAKLVITTPPAQIFGASPESGCLDYIRPLYILLQHDESTLLQQFEALMALTNIASIGPSVSSRIMKTPNLIVDVESKMLDDNVLVRRAAVQLVCNLVACEDGYIRYGGEVGDDKSSGLAPAIGQRLHILLALTDVDDLPTRLAASGALASLSPADAVIKALIDLDGTGHKLMSRTAGMLGPSDLAVDGGDAEDVEEISTSPPDMGLVHRAVVILESTLIYVKGTKDSLRSEVLRQATSCGVVRNLMAMLAEWTQPNAPRPPAEVAEGVISALKMLKALGVDIAKEA